MASPCANVTGATFVTDARPDRVDRRAGRPPRRVARAARVPGPLGGRRRPARRPYRATSGRSRPTTRPASWPSTRGCRAGDDLLPVLRPLSRAVRAGRRTVHPRRPQRPGGPGGHRGRRADRRGPLRPDQPPARPRSPSSSRDDHQGRGPGQRCCSSTWPQPAGSGASRRFVAEVLPNNRRMMATFREAGYVVSQRMEDGVFHLTFDLEPTETVLSVRAAREHRSEARSVERLLNPVGVAVIGASRTPGRIGHELLRHLRDYGSRAGCTRSTRRPTSILGRARVPARHRHPAAGGPGGRGGAGRERGGGRRRLRGRGRGRAWSWSPPGSPTPPRTRAAQRQRTPGQRAPESYGMRAGRAELPGHHQHRPAGQPQRLAVAGDAPPGPGRASSASPGPWG